MSIGLASQVERVIPAGVPLHLPGSAFSWKWGRTTVGNGDEHAMSALPRSRGDHLRSEKASGSASVSESLTRGGNVITRQWGKQPHLVIVTGSGLDYIAELVYAEAEVAYADIPGFPLARVPGHSGSQLLDDPLITHHHRA